jgi:hypothetical protein
MSVRSNQDRLGIDQAILEHQDAPPMEATIHPQGESPQLNFIVPTEFVELPSKGKFYSPSHPLCDQEHVEIRHMTAKDEDILTSKTLLKQGVALDRMLQNIIVDKQIKVKDLLLGDKNSLIVSARTHGYGAEYVTRISCPQCNLTQQYSFDLSGLESTDYEEEMKKWDVEITPDNTLLLPLPKTQFVVELRFLTGADESRMNAQTKRRKKHNFADTFATDHLRSIVVSVNDITDKEQINKFINSIPAIDSKYIRRVYKNVMPTVDLNHNFVCSNCDYEDDMEVPFNTDFFWSNS